VLAARSDHRHSGEKESACTFTTPDRLIADFRRDIASFASPELLWKLLTVRRAAELFFRSRP
jgi:hypothetical protein